VTRWFSRAAVVQTIHGFDDERAKWGGPAQRVLRAGRWLSAHVPDATVTVSESLAARYAEQFQRTAYYVPNGVRVLGHTPETSYLNQLGLEPQEYLLFVGRVVPEKAVHTLLQAYAKDDTPYRLVVAGGSSHTDDYSDEVGALASTDPRVLLPGFVYGDDLRQLYSHAAVFVLPSRLEGLPLALLEAASYGTPIVASDIPPHVEILGADDGPGRRVARTGDVGSLADAIERSLEDPEAERAGAAELKRHVEARFSWAVAAEQLEQVYEDARARAAERRHFALHRAPSS
jgi:glycosyltransferase involved in cell wall biosynthesis